MDTMQLQGSCSEFSESLTIRRIDTVAEEQIDDIATMQTKIDTGCDRIRKDIDLIQTASLSLGRQVNRYIAESNNVRSESLRGPVDEHDYMSLYVEMARQREVANRLESLMMLMSPLLPIDKQVLLATAICQAKQFSPQELEAYADYQVQLNSSPLSPNGLEKANIATANEKPTESSILNVLLQQLLHTYPENNTTKNQTANLAPVHGNPKQAGSGPKQTNRNKPKAKKKPIKKKEPAKSKTVDIKAEAPTAPLFQMSHTASQQHPFQQSQLSCSQNPMRHTRLCKEGHSNTQARAN